MNDAGGIDDTPEITLDESRGQLAKSSTAVPEQSLRIIARRDEEDAGCQHNHEHKHINRIHLPFPFHERCCFLAAVRHIELRAQSRSQG